MTALPSSPTSSMSVKVPPISMATRYMVKKQFRVCGFEFQVRSPRSFKTRDSKPETRNRGLALRKQIQQSLGLMRCRGPQKRNLDSGVAVLLHAFFNFARRAAGGHALDVGIRNRLDEPFHAALGVGFFEERNVFFLYVGLAHAHLRCRNEGNLDGIKFRGDFPAHRIEGFLMVVFDRTVDYLLHLEIRNISTGRRSGLANNLQRIDGILRRANRIQYNAVRDLPGQPQACGSCRWQIDRNASPQGLPSQTHIVEINELSVVRAFLALEQ